MEENGNMSLEEQIKDLDEKIEDTASKFVDSWNNVKFTKALLISTLCVWIVAVIINKVFMNFSVSGTIISVTICGVPGLVEGIAYFCFKKDARKWSKVLNEQRNLKKTLDRELEREKELQNTPEYHIEKTKSAIEEFKKNINQDFESMLGISYDDYQKLSPEEQQKLIQDFHKKADNPPIVDDMKEGKVSLVGSGEESSIIRQGTIEDLIESKGGHQRKLTKKSNNNQNNKRWF